MTILETERLLLVETTNKDAPFILDLLNSPPYLRYIGDRGVKTIAQAEEYIAEKFTQTYKKQGFGFYLVKTKADNKPIGICGLVKRDTLPDVDIGFAFLPKYIGLGYGYESASAIMDFARRDLGLKKLLAITLPNNRNSIKLLERLGFQFEKRFRMEGDPEELMLFGNEA